MTDRGENSARSEYPRVKQEVDSRFPVGRFVAVEAGKVVADGESHPELVGKLAFLGKSPQGMLIFQAGVVYPDSATILLASAADA